MQKFWWAYRRNKEKRNSHAISASRTFLGLEVHTAYCGRRAINTPRKEYGELDDAIKEDYKVCQKCWDNLPAYVLKDITHLL